jgi:L-threonylcarbamoyladenylate synthase
MSAADQIKEEVLKCLPILKAGGTILYPTDTIWGIGCDATNEQAVKKVFEIKEREESKSLIILLHSPDQLNKYVKNVPAPAWDLIEFTEKPLTIVFDGGVNVAKNVMAADGTIAIRIIKNNFCNELLRRFGKPIVSTSANTSSKETPLLFMDIDAAISAQVDYVVNLPAEKNKKGTPSLILKMDRNSVIKFLRK